MKCEKAVDWIVLHAADDLPPRKAAKLRAHLEDCSSCRRELEEFRAALVTIRTDARNESAEEWDETAWKALMGRITAGEPGKERPIPGHLFRRPAAAYGAAAGLLLAGVFLLLRDRIPGPDAVSSAPARVIVEKQEAPGPSAIPPQPRQPEKPETQAPGTGIRTPAARETALRTGREPEAFAAAPAQQEVVSVTLVSRETGLQIVWFFDKNFEWKGDER